MDKLKNESEENNHNKDSIEDLNESDEVEESIENLIEDMSEMEFIQTFMEHFYKDQWKEFIKILRDIKKQKEIIENIEQLQEKSIQEENLKKTFLYDKNSMIKLKEFHTHFFKKRSNRKDFLLIYFYDHQIKPYRKSEIELNDDKFFEIKIPDNIVLVSLFKDGFQAVKDKKEFVTGYNFGKNVKHLSSVFPEEVRIKKDENHSYYLAIDSKKTIYSVGIPNNNS